MKHYAPYTFYPATGQAPTGPFTSLSRAGVTLNGMISIYEAQAAALRGTPQGLYFQDLAQQTRRQLRAAIDAEFAGSPQLSLPSPGTNTATVVPNAQGGMLTRTEPSTRGGDATLVAPSRDPRHAHNGERVVVLGTGIPEIGAPSGAPNEWWYIQTLGGLVGFSRAVDGQGVRNFVAMFSRRGNDTPSRGVVSAKEAELATYTQLLKTMRGNPAVSQSLQGVVYDLQRQLQVLRSQIGPITGAPLSTPPMISALQQTMVALQGTISIYEAKAAALRGTSQGLNFQDLAQQTRRQLQAVLAQIASYGAEPAGSPQLPPSPATDTAMVVPNAQGGMLTRTEPSTRGGDATLVAPSGDPRHAHNGERVVVLRTGIPEIGAPSGAPNEWWYIQTLGGLVGFSRAVDGQGIRNFDALGDPTPLEVFRTPSPLLENIAAKEAELATNTQLLKTMRGNPAVSQSLQGVIYDLQRQLQVLRSRIGYPGSLRT